MEFVLDSRIEEDTFVLGQLPLCRVRLHRDGRYPWVILVPARPSIREIHELTMDDRAQLLAESCAIAAAMQETLGAEKMNVAALGNMVPQLHLHHVARYAHDDAWPGAIWGAHPPLEYIGDQLEQRVATLREAFESIDGFEPG